MRIINKGNYREGEPLADPQWLPDLHSAIFAYNCRQHSAHGQPPFVVFRGRRPHIPNAVAQDQETDETLASCIQRRAQYLQQFEENVRLRW